MFETDVLLYKRSYVNRRKGKSAEESSRSDMEFRGHKVTRVPDRVGGRDFDVRRRKFYET